jgi:hypothetical protein
MRKRAASVGVAGGGGSAGGGGGGMKCELPVATLKKPLISPAG